MNNLIARLMPFLILGVAVVMLSVGIVVFSYLLVIGVCVGLAFFAVNWLRNKLFSPKYAMKTPYKVKRGRIIEHDDFKY